MKFTVTIKRLVILSVLFAFSSCTDYWWSRGQAPAVEELLSRSERKLDNAVIEHSTRRKEFAAIAEEVKLALLGSIEDRSKVSSANKSFLKLEGRISYGSRPAYGELSGQLRVFENKSGTKNFPKEAFTLYVSRVFDFLANEFETA